MRGRFLSLRTEEFVTAARLDGASEGRIIFRHMIPNVLGPIIVYTTLTIPAVMLLEAFVSFLGLGVKAPMTSWGLMIKEAASSALPRFHGRCSLASPAGPASAPNPPAITEMKLRFIARHMM